MSNEPDLDFKAAAKLVQTKLKAAAKGKDVKQAILNLYDGMPGAVRALVGFARAGHIQAWGQAGKEMKLLDRIALMSHDIVVQEGERTDPVSRVYDEHFVKRLGRKKPDTRMMWDQPKKRYRYTNLSFSRKEIEDLDFREVLNF